MGTTLSHPKDLDFYDNVPSYFSSYPLYKSNPKNTIKKIQY